MTICNNLTYGKLKSTDSSGYFLYTDYFPITTNSYGSTWFHSNYDLHLNLVRVDYCPNCHASRCTWIKIPATWSNRRICSPNHIIRRHNFISLLVRFLLWTNPTDMTKLIAAITIFFFLFDGYFLMPLFESNNIYHSTYRHQCPAEVLTWPNCR